MTTCPFCGIGCNLYLQVLEGELVDVLPCKSHPISQGQLCVLGRNAHKFVQHKDRLQTPLIRKQGKLEPASWEEAHSLISDRLLNIRNTHGSEAIGVLASAKCTNEENYLLMKLARGVLGTNSIDHCARLCHSSTVAGLAAAFGAGAMTNSIPEIEDTECLLVIGSNTTSQHPMIASRMIRAKEKGAGLIVIDPRAIALTEYSDLFLKLKPGTNVALINGMLKVLIDQDLIDREFIAKRTEAFEALQAKVQEYPLERVSRITGLSEEQIENAAVMYGRVDKAMIIYAMGITQQTAATENVQAVANLTLATGNIGRPGTGVNPLRGQNNVQGACDMGALPTVLTDYKQVLDSRESSRFAQAWGMQLPATPGLTLVEMMQAASSGQLKAMYIMGENPLISDPDVNHVHKALQSLELLVVQDIFLTETAELADVVLPGTSYAEKEGTVTNTDRRIQMIRPALEPVGESKPDWKIIMKLAQAMGAEGFDFASPREIMQEITQVTKSYRGISYERLEKGESLQWPCPSLESPGTPYLFAQEFPLGRGKFHALDHVDPSEMPDSEYPFILSTGRIPFHFHGGSMTRRVERLNKEAPKCLLHIHADDARKLGIADGGQVQVSSRRGKIQVQARITDEVEPELVFMPMHYAESLVNVLTDTKLDPVAKIPNFKVCAVNIQKQ